MDFTEADEAAGGSKTRALARLGEQVRAGETMGVIAMYERAALNLGASLTETEDVMRQARANGVQ
jgi:hypothetical protein